MKDRVIIAGAGVSGLYAATLLEKAGVDYLVLEARSRTGGRVLSGQILAGNDNGIHVDMGATWFWPAIQPEFAQLIHSLDIPLIHQGRPGDMLYERQLNVLPERYPAYETSPESYRLKGGMQAFTAALKKQIPAHKFMLNHRVIAISRHDQEVQVHVRSETGENPVLSGSHVFIAMPPSLAAGINFTPTLPDGMLTNWRKTPTWMAPHAKYAALYRNDFLAKQNLSGDVSSRAGPMVEIHDVSEPASGVTAIFGFIGVPAASRNTVSETMLKQLCREQLIRLFGDEAAEPDLELIKDWAADPFTATHSDLQQDVGHASPVQLPVHSEWRGKLTGIASEWSPRFSGYLAGAVDAASEGVYQWLDNSQ